MVFNVKKDLSSKFGEIRDQGNRPTCMAFAASDCHSFARNTLNPFSVEYSFYQAVQLTSAKDRQIGISFEKISQVLSVIGQPVEDDWKYINNLSASSPWLPPVTLGTLFKRNSKKISSDLNDVFSNLDKDIPVILVTDISDSFYTHNSNVVLNALSTETQRGTHAIIAVGYAEMDKAKCILIRNSWGIDWGDNGYAWVHEDYLKSRVYLIGAME